MAAVVVTRMTIKPPIEGIPEELVSVVVGEETLKIVTVSITEMYTEARRLDRGVVDLAVLPVDTALGRDAMSNHTALPKGLQWEPRRLIELTLFLYP